MVSGSGGSCTAATPFRDPGTWRRERFAYLAGVDRTRLRQRETAARPHQPLPSGLVADREVGADGESMGQCGRSGASLPFTYSAIRTPLPGGHHVHHFVLWNGDREVSAKGAEALISARMRPLSRMDSPYRAWTPLAEVDSRGSAAGSHWGRARRAVPPW